MPYINGALRIEVEPYSTRLAATPGELNYQLTRLCHWYLHSHTPNYETMNAIVGALECAKQEFLRRIVAPYEDTKIAENGDL